MKYKRELRDCPGVTFQKINDDVQIYWNMVIRIHNNTSYKQLEEYFKNHNIETRPMFIPYKVLNILINCE